MGGSMPLAASAGDGARPIDLKKRACGGSAAGSTGPYGGAPSTSWIQPPGLSRRSRRRVVATAEAQVGWKDRPRGEERGGKC